MKAAIEVPAATPVDGTPSPLPVDKLIEGYIKLRDKKDALKKEFDSKVENINATMTKIENALLKHLNSVGGDSIKTPAGTVFKKTVSSASVADWDQVLDFIRDNELWSMLERRVSKAAVEQYRAEHDDLPPGVNWSETVVVNIRRS